MTPEPIQARATIVAKDISHKIAPTCRTCHLRGITCHTETDLSNDGIRIRTRVHCGKGYFTPCPDELEVRALPEDYRDASMYSAKDFGMYRNLANNEFEHHLLVPMMEFEETPFRMTREAELHEFWNKVVEHEMFEYDQEIVNEWWSLLDYYGALKASWHGQTEDLWSEAKRKYMFEHLREVKMDGGPTYIKPTTFMKKNIPYAEEPFPAHYTAKDHRPARVVHPPSGKPSEKKFAPPPPPKYHNWGAWGS